MKEEIKYNTTEKIVIYLLSVAVGGFAVIFALFLAASVCLAVDMSDNYSTFVAGICLGAGAACSGFLTGKKIKSGGIVNGALCGLIMYAAVLLISLFVSDTGFSVVSLSHALISILSSAIGGVVGVNFSYKKKII